MFWYKFMLKCGKSMPLEWAMGWGKPANSLWESQRNKNMFDVFLNIFPVLGLISIFQMKLMLKWQKITVITVIFQPKNCHLQNEICGNAKCVQKNMDGNSVVAIAGISSWLLFHLCNIQSFKLTRRFHTNDKSLSPRKLSYYRVTVTVTIPAAIEAPIQIIWLTVARFILLLKDLIRCYISVVSCRCMEIRRHFHRNHFF